MLKRVLIILLMVSLSGCIPNYEKKHDENINYYTDFLDENGIVEYEREAAPTGVNLVETIYRMNNIDEECNSRNIRVYYGIEETTGKPVTVYMPDKVGEPDIIVYDLTYEIEELREIISEYNLNTTSVEIILDEDQIRLRNVNMLWGGLIINDVRQEIDEDKIQTFVFENLSNSMIYNIGNLTDGKDVFLGLNKNNEYVFFSQSNDHNTLDIIYTYLDNTTQDD